MMNEYDSICREIKKENYSVVDGILTPLETEIRTGIEDISIKILNNILLLLNDETVKCNFLKYVIATLGYDFVSNNTDTVIKWASCTKNVRGYKCYIEEYMSGGRLCARLRDKLTGKKIVSISTDLSGKSHLLRFLSECKIWSYQFNNYDIFDSISDGAYILVLGDVYSIRTDKIELWDNDFLTYLLC